MQLIWWSGARTFYLWVPDSQLVAICAADPQQKTNKKKTQ